MKKSFLITGATKGIGLATAKHLSKAGYDVIGIARRKPQSEFPGHLYLANLSDAEETEAVFKQIKINHAINGLINNVGTVKPQKIDQMDIISFKEVIDLNVRPAIQALSYFLPQMKEQKWGRIVNITSRALLGKAGTSSFSAAKAALTALTRTWALELAQTGITVNAIAPGPIETESFFNNYPPGSIKEKNILSTIPMGRIGLPDEIAFAISFFLNEQAGFITGQTLFVDGGGSIGITYN